MHHRECKQTTCTEMPRSLSRWAVHCTQTPTQIWIEIWSQIKNIQIYRKSVRRWNEMTLEIGMARMQRSATITRWMRIFSLSFVKFHLLRKLISTLVSDRKKKRSPTANPRYWRTMGEPKNQSISSATTTATADAVASTSHIAKWFAGQILFITGSTGYVPPGLK